MRSSRLLCAAVALVGLAACHKTSGTRAAKEDLALVPQETNMVLMANVTRLRGTAMWKKIEDLRNSDPATKKNYDDFVAKCGLDPFTQIDSVFAAFPAATPGAATPSKDFAAILRGKFDEQKLIACARDQAQKDGSQLVVSDYDGKKLYSDSKEGEAYATFIDSSMVALGSGSWIRKVLDLQGNKAGAMSAKQNPTLVALIKRAKTSHGFWAAGLVPPEAREALRHDPQLASAATMKDAFGSVDFSNGFDLDLNVDTASPQDAKALSDRVTGQLAELRKSPQLMMMGLSQYLDGVKAQSKESTFELDVSYKQPQMDELINRVKGLLKSFGGAVAPSAGAGMNLAPPVAAPVPAPAAPAPEHSRQKTKHK